MARCGASTIAARWAGAACGAALKAKAQAKAPPIAAMMRSNGKTPPHTQNGEIDPRPAGIPAARCFHRLNCGEHRDRGAGPQRESGCVRLRTLTLSVKTPPDFTHVLKRGGGHGR